MCSIWWANSSQFRNWWQKLLAYLLEACCRYSLLSYCLSVTMVTRSCDGTTPSPWSINTWLFDGPVGMVTNTKYIVIWGGSDRWFMCDWYCHSWPYGHKLWYTCHQCWIDPRTKRLVGVPTVYHSACEMSMNALVVFKWLHVAWTGRQPWVFVV